MSSPKRGMFVNPVDHTIRHSLRRAVEDHQPRAEVRRRLLQRAAERDLVNRWPSLFSESLPEYSSGALLPVELGWRELAFVQALRPAGVFGALTQLR